MNYYQSFITPLTQGAVRSPGPGYAPMTSQGYITNPGGQQYIPMQPRFYPQQSIQQGTYVSPSQQQERIELNPNAVAYQSYSSPPPGATSPRSYPSRGGAQFQTGSKGYQGNDLTFQGPYQSEQMYQDRSEQFAPAPVPLFRPYQNGPEVMRTASPKPQQSVTQHALKAIPQTFTVPPPTQGRSTIQKNKPENSDGMTLSYPDDQSMFVKDAGQVPSSSAEDVFKAKALMYGIEICNKAEKHAGKQEQVVKNTQNSSNNDSVKVTGEKPPEMLFKMTHIEPEESTDSDNEDSAVFSQSETNRRVHPQSVPETEHVSHQFYIGPQEIDKCVVYNPETESIPENSLSKRSFAISCESVGESDSFVTAKEASSASDGEIGIFRNYVLEALLTTKSPQTEIVGPMHTSEVCAELCETVNVDHTEELDEVNGDAFDRFVEEYVKSIIKKAYEVVKQQCYLPECKPEIAITEKTEEERIIGCRKADHRNLYCVEENRTLKVEENGLLVNHVNKTSNAKHEHQINTDDSNNGPVEQTLELSLDSSINSWTMAWNEKGRNSLDENSNYCNSSVLKVQAYHNDSESTELSSDYSDSGSQLNPISSEFKPRRKNRSSTMRPDAPVFQPLNVQTLPESVKKSRAVIMMREVVCQTDEKEYREVASNTHRVKQVDCVSETVSCDTREVCVNTVDSCFTEDNEYFLKEQATYSEKGTLTESLDQKSIGVLVKPHALDICMVDKESMTEPLPDYLESLIATQRELLHLRGNVCAMELQRQIHELERNKLLFQDMQGEALDKVLDDRITSLKIELNIIQNQVVGFDAHLAAGNVFKSVPQFTVSIPIGNQSVITVNKVFIQKTKTAATKRPFSDAHTAEEERSLWDLGTKPPVKMSNKDNSHSKSAVSFQMKPPQTFDFTTTKGDSCNIHTEMDTGMKNSKQGLNISRVTTGATDSMRTDSSVQLDMDKIDDNVSLPELSKPPALNQADPPERIHPGGPGSESVRNVKPIVNDLPTLVSVDSGQRFPRHSVVTGDLSCRGVVTEAKCGSVTQPNTSSSGVTGVLHTTELATLCSSLASASYTPGSVVSASGNMTNPLKRQNLVPVQRAAQMVSGTPLLTTPRMIQGQPGVILYPQGPPVVPHLRQSQPNIPPYCPVQPSLLPYPPVLPTVPSVPVVAMKTPLLPQPPIARLSTSAYQGKPLFQSTVAGQTSQPLGVVSSGNPAFQSAVSGQTSQPLGVVSSGNPAFQSALTGQTSQPLGVVSSGNPAFQSAVTGQTSQPLGVVSASIGQAKTITVPSQTLPSVLPVQTSNPSGQLNLSSRMNSSAEQGRRNQPMSSSNVTSCEATSISNTATKEDKPSIDPELHQAVIAQLRQAYPALATDPVWLETVGLQQTMVLQNYIDGSKSVVSDKDSNNTVQESLNTDVQKREESTKVPTSSCSEVSNGDSTQTVINENSAVISSRQPPGFESLASTDVSLSEKFEDITDINLKEGAKGLVKTISDLTKTTRQDSQNDHKEITQTNRNPGENKTFQHTKSLLDNFMRVEKPVVHEPKVSTVYHDSFCQQDNPVSNDTNHNALVSKKSKNMCPQFVPEKTSKEAVRRPTPTSGENWEVDVNPNPIPFQHDFRKVRPAEKTKASWLAEVSRTNVPPGLPAKKSTVVPTAVTGSTEGKGGMAVIPTDSKAVKKSGDEDCVSGGEDWHQVSKKKKEKKKTESERTRRKSGSDAPRAKSNNFEKLITKLSEVFTTLSRDSIIELITEVRNTTKGLSGLNMKQIITLARQVFIANRHYYQSDLKQKTSPNPKSQKSQRLSPLPIVGMTAVPGPGKTYNFKPLSMSVIQTKEIPLIDDEEEICVICHDALLMEETKTLECGHVFHSACIKQWVFGQERTCPNCRRLALFPEEFPRLGK